MKKNSLIKIILFLIISISIISCSDDNNEILKPNTDLVLKQSKTTITPFEKLTVSIDLDLELLYNAYDSIKWECNGTWMNGIFTIPDNSDIRDLDVTDYRLGKNKVSILGYKDGEIKSKSSVEYNVVKPTNDFFTIKWGEPEQETNYYTTSRRVKADNESQRWEGIRLKTIHFSKDKPFEHAVLEFYPHSFTSSVYTKSAKEKVESITLPDIDNYDFFQKSGDWNLDIELRNKAILMTRSFWHSYITLIYGESIFKYEGEDVRQTTLWEEYNKRFKNKLVETYPAYGEKYPVEIWETQTTSICLYSLYTGWYYVLAEPNTK